MSKQVILTAPVSEATQRRVRRQAKANKVPIRVLCAMLIEHAMSDIENGKLAISQPSITKP